MVILVFALALSAFIVFKAIKTNKVSNLSEAMYDTMIRHRIWAPAIDPRIVIIDIDESSLLAMSSEFGRWPWPRDTLASALTFVSKQKPKAIVWDILFSDLDTISPGGDQAFNEAVLKSTNNIHTVVRLPASYDNKSQVNYKALPALWITDKDSAKPVTATIAIIPPILPALLKTQLGYNNAYADEDGILRKYKWSETLSDTSKIQSLGIAVAKVVDQNAVIPKRDTLINWRTKANSYPRHSFAEVFSEADNQTKTGRFNFENKIVIFGATAAGLHDRLPTALNSNQTGVDVLATVIDNAINGQFLFDLPATLVAGLGLLVVWFIAYIALANGVEALHGGLVIVPTVLLLISFASLHGSVWFVDLTGAAGAGLALVAGLKIWNNWRRDYWCGPSQRPEGLLIITSTTSVISDDRTNDLLFKLFEINAPTCRLVGGDASAPWPAKLRWPELLNYFSIVGPLEELANIQHLTNIGVEPFNTACICSDIQFIQASATKYEIATQIAYELAALRNTLRDSSKEPA
jgi:adenylate cyclase